ncbi:hypothetical protein VTO42DRAFT_1383 [Malbranchea cinnamomea]
MRRSSVTLPAYNDAGLGKSSASRDEGLGDASASIVHSNPSTATRAGLTRMDWSPDSPAFRRSSVSEKTPTRSFVHRTFHGSLGAGQYSVRGTHDETAEVESMAFSDGESIQSGRSVPTYSSGPLFARGEGHDTDWDRYGSRPRPETIEEGSEPFTSAEGTVPSHSGESALTAMLRLSPPTRQEEEQQDDFASNLSTVRSLSSSPDLRDERTGERQPLIQKAAGSRSLGAYGATVPSIDPGSAPVSKNSAPYDFTERNTYVRLLKKQFSWRNLNPKSWDRRTIWQKGIVHPISYLPAVLLGLLLNILDALSYGIILFPLGEPMFANLGSDGISMFYVSTIISQLVFSCGGSIFKGGIGSEMIEVVPFFHRMAFMILAKVGKENVRSVLATTILSYAISAVLTGTVFFVMGVSGLGSLIGFFPRHILIGCIGGVGWFLVATGVEVSARLPGNLEYNLETLERLFQADTVFLWTTPLVLAILFLVIRRFIKSNYLVGGYFLSISLIFYFFKLVLGVSLTTLREKGWVFEAPSGSVPWYHFYTLYDFSAVDWQALADTVPTMFALTFFGILHVPINVPALGISTGEDQLNVDRELIAHGISNALSGFAGSIQNYLVYTNSLLFIDSGGNSRLAGIMLAFATFGVLLAGPGIVGFIPIMVVGALIYMLGIELMEEALVETWRKLHNLEYITVVIIVVTMGAWDFVTGIVIGIILACVNFVLQTSQKSAITATYTGQVAISTVRRHPLHVRFLREAGRQTFVIKLAGFLFFGTIVSVEKRIRWLIEGETFSKRPIRFLVLDLSHVNGLDFSAAEAFTRLNRLLRKRKVQMIISGLDLTGDTGKSLRNVGLFEERNQVEIFADLNSALEFCENELLKALHARKNALAPTFRRSPQPVTDASRLHVPSTGDFMYNSPRGSYLNQIAASALREEAEGCPYASTQQKGHKYPQPLPLLMQAFQGLTNKDDEFWAPICLYFTQAEYPASSVLYREGEVPRHFYLLESGMLRAEYDTPQGSYFELIVAGRPCGELPFFGETRRTATVRAERDCVVWMMGVESWEKVRAKEPIVAMELMKMCLKLTAERMESITSYVLTATR